VEVKERKQQATGHKPQGKGTFVEPEMLDLRHKGIKGCMVPALLSTDYAKEIDYYGVSRLWIIYH
jgi:hypothetical protein